MPPSYPKMAQFRTVDQLRGRLEALGLDLPLDDRLQAGAASALAQPAMLGRWRIGNRWCIHPMEGWDGEQDGRPSELTRRRWCRFGQSGAKLIWGGEAAAVRADGRANPRQLVAVAANRSSLAALLRDLIDAHRNSGQSAGDLVVGLQLTHSGRFSRPEAGRGPQPRIVYHHPELDRRVGVAADDDTAVWTDSELERLMDDYLQAAQVAAEAGFHFVDIKACHGYLLHEALSAFRRPGRFGGDYAGRTLLLRTLVERVRGALPELEVGVRLSVLDSPPFEARGGEGRPVLGDEAAPYDLAFGVRPEHPLEIDLREPIRLIRDLAQLGVAAINVTAGSPYYSPHIQRPAMFPPSDGYPLPEDPLAGVVRQIQAARQCKEAVPEMVMVGTGYSYLQEFLPHAAQAVVGRGWIDLVGLGRMVLSYPELPRDVLEGRALRRKQICRTFSDCTTGPRNHLVSGCYPLDPFYKQLDDAQELQRAKSRTSRGSL